MHLSGKVQGVNLRHLIRLQALQHHLVGWSRNEPDGTVTLEVEGERQELQKMYDWLLQSPGSSSIVDVQMKWMQPQQNETLLTIVP
jgi:acylphosphatase